MLGEHGQQSRLRVCAARFSCPLESLTSRRMGQLSRRLVPDIKEDDPRYDTRLQRMLDEPRKLAPAAKQNLTTLHLLLQNRRKDNVPVLVFGGLTQVVTKPSGTKDALRGRRADDDVMMFTRNGSVSESAQMTNYFPNLVGFFQKQKVYCDWGCQRPLGQRHTSPCSACQWRRGKSTGIFRENTLTRRSRSTFHRIRQR